MSSDTRIGILDLDFCVQSASERDLNWQKVQRAARGGYRPTPQVKHTIDPDIFEPDERLPNAAVALAQAQAQIRVQGECIEGLRDELVGRDRSNMALCDDLRAMVESRNGYRDGLKVMTEDRDEYQRMYQAEVDSTKRRLTWQGDEGKVLRMLSERLELGEKSYGALDVHDGRDMLKEGTEEALDLVIYLTCKLVAMQETGR